MNQQRDDRNRTQQNESTQSSSTGRQSERSGEQYKSGMSSTSTGQTISGQSTGQQTGGQSTTGQSNIGQSSTGQSSTGQSSSYGTSRYSEGSGSSLGRGSSSMREGAEQLRERGESGVRSTLDFISERPVTAAAIALGVGSAVYAVSRAMSTEQSSPSRFYDTIRNRFHEGLESAYEQREPMMRKGRSAASEFKRSLARARRSARDASNGFTDDLQSYLESGYSAGAKTVRESVGRHPLATVALVLGFGAAVASIVRSGKTRRAPLGARPVHYRRENLRYEELSTQELCEVAQERGIQNATTMNREEIIHSLRTL